jgi:hypothetical protein
MGGRRPARPVDAVIKVVERRTAAAPAGRCWRCSSLRRGATTAWLEMGLDLRRSAIAAAVERVTVNPTEQRWPRFDDSRVDGAWTDSE